MKKYISVILILAMLMGISSCSTETAKKPEIPEYNLEVTHEKFEDMPVVSASGSYLGYENESEMYDSCDLVVIGMLDETFTDGNGRRHGLNGEILADGSTEMVACVSTLRNMTVLEVLKGENVGETLKFANSAISGVDDDGTEIILWLPENEFIQKKNVKYVFYLNEASRKDGVYYAASDQGVINIDGLDINGSRGKFVTEERYDEVKARFGQYFEKYDRSAETEK